jgi:hypothetical protein
MDVHFHHVQIPFNITKLIETPAKAMENPEVLCQECVPKVSHVLEG